MNFKKWLFLLEENGIRSFKKPNPKNPSQNFIVLYGNTYPIKDELKKIGFRYFKGTWSTLESKLTDEIKSKLENLGVDFSGLESSTEQETIEKPSTLEKTKTNSILDNMKDELEIAMKSEGASPKLKSLTTTIEKMIEKVASSTDEAAKQDFVKNFLKFSSKFYKYSITNQILIWVQSKGKATHVASPTNWIKLGRQVKNWDEGIVIFAPNFKTIEKDNPITNQKEKLELKYFRTVKVYDFESTEPIPGHKNSFKPLSVKDWRKDSDDDVEELNILINSLSEWIKEKSINVDYEELAEDLGGYSSGGKIAINNKFKGIRLFSVLVHETAHEILHWLESKSRSELASKSSRKEMEIDAETTAAIVSNYFGFETLDAPNYLALWRASGKDIIERKQNIHKSSKLIIEGIQSKIKEVEFELDHNDEM